MSNEFTAPLERRSPLARCLSATCSGYLKDLHVYDPVAMTWEEISVVVYGTPPSPRGKHGFASAGGKLYVHGGQDDNGNTWKLNRLSDFKFGS